MLNKLLKLKQLGSFSEYFKYNEKMLWYKHEEEKRTQLKKELAELEKQLEFKNDYN